MASEMDFCSLSHPKTRRHGAGVVSYGVSGVCLKSTA